MGEHSEISWTDATFNPWHGCTPVSPGCKNCYARTLSDRYEVGHFGAGAPRRFFGEKHWAEPLAWDRKAAKAGRRTRVFCGSMCDFLDAEVAQEYRDRLYRLIEATPHLLWLLLTKRPENLRTMLPEAWLREPRENVALGVTAEDQERADARVPHLLACPARWRFVSYEPAIGPLDLGFEAAWDIFDSGFSHGPAILKLDGVIAGAESGPKARHAETKWFRSVRDQCRAAGAEFYLKQMEVDGRLVKMPQLDGVVWAETPWEAPCGR